MIRIDFHFWWKLYWVDKVRKKERRQFKKRRRSRLSNQNVTILASNCNGTIMYHDLDLPYLSPTINLWFKDLDFVKMMENLEWYMNGQIIEVTDKEEDYPVGMLHDIKIYFRHYDSFEEAVSKWEERKKRIRWNNLFIVGSCWNGDYEVIQRFEQLPYKNKVIFSPIPYPEFQSVYYVKKFKRRWGVMTDFKDQFLKRRYLDDFDYVAFLNQTK